MYHIIIGKNRKKGMHNGYCVKLGKWYYLLLCAAKIYNLFEKSKYFSNYFAKNNIFIPQWGYM